ncbi:MAG TPA: serine protease [Polyangiaceae bacterium]
MSWFDSLVQIQLGIMKGSGLFISPTEVLTAAHVVAPNGTIPSMSELTLDIRFQSRSATPRSVALLPAWVETRTSGSDIALVQVDSEDGLGVLPVFGVPAVNASTMLEGHGFIAATDEQQTLAGHVSFQPPSADEPFLFSADFSPIPGMSGGPLVTALGGAVRTAGILAQRSDNHFIGLAALQSVLALLRANL